MMRRAFPGIVVVAAAVAVARPAAVFGRLATLSTPAVSALSSRPLVVGEAALSTHVHPVGALGAGTGGVVSTVVDDSSLPASAAAAADRLAKSPRHREDVMIPTRGGAAGGDSVHAWIFYPQVSGKAPVVVVIHEIFGVSTWIKGVADQLAADGFIAVVPDLLYGKPLPGAPDNVPHDAAIAAIRTLDPAAVQRQIDAAAAYATHLPAALPVYGTVGFCWGGGVSFAHDVQSAPGAPPLKATIVYYGTPPDSTQLPVARAPVLGLYGGNDARVTLTAPGTDSAMRRLHKTYEYKIYQGAGHGFLRAQEDEGGANAAATRDAWPRTIAWFRKYLRT